VTDDHAGTLASWIDADGLGWRLTRLGPAALRLAADDPPSADLSARLAAVRTAAWSNRPPALRDLIVGYRALTAELRIGAPLAPAAQALRTATREAARAGADQRRVTLPVAYGDAADRAELEARLRLPWREIVARHAAAAYRVAFLGFTPGFPYLHGLPGELALPRRPAPAPARRRLGRDRRRPRGRLPERRPGRLVGARDDAGAAVRPVAATPATLLPGDEVRFEPTAARVDAGVVAAAPAAADAGVSSPALTVVEAWPGGASLQGRPRTGVGHLGMAQAGALDARAFVSAARLAGAPLAAPAIELTVPHATLRAERPLTAACTGGGARLRLDGRPVSLGQAFAWPAGAHLEVRPDARTSGAHVVLAVGGGLAPAGGPVGHPELVGEGSTDARAGVGGFGRRCAAATPCASRALHGRRTAAGAEASTTPGASRCDSTRDPTARTRRTPRCSRPASAWARATAWAPGSTEAGSAPDSPTSPPRACRWARCNYPPAAAPSSCSPTAGGPAAMPWRASSTRATSPRWRRRTPAQRSRSRPRQSEGRGRAHPVGYHGPTPWTSESD
jgi:hypothetical protein